MTRSEHYWIMLPDQPAIAPDKVRVVDKLVTTDDETSFVIVLDPSDHYTFAYDTYYKARKARNRVLLAVAKWKLREREGLQNLTINMSNSLPPMREPVQTLQVHPTEEEARQSSEAHLLPVVWYDVTTRSPEINVLVRARSTVDGPTFRAAKLTEGMWLNYEPDSPSYGRPVAVLQWSYIPKFWRDVATDPPPIDALVQVRHVPKGHTMLAARIDAARGPVWISKEPGDSFDTVIQTPFQWCEKIAPVKCTCFEPTGPDYCEVHAA